MPVFRIPRELVFPEPALACGEPNGLLGVGGDLSPDRLLLAYRSGIFPWYSPGEPILWWSPDPRMVLYPDQLHVPHSLRRVLRRTGLPDAGTPRRRKECGLTVTLDQAFEQVIAACASMPRPGQHGQHGQPGTWITPAMRKAYVRLHQLGQGHSCETWRDGQLAGGIYGVAIGRFFAAESMFFRVPEASKVALVCLVRQLRRWGFRLIDSQVHTAHVARFGGVEIPRTRYLAELAEAAAQPGRERPWAFDADFDPLA